MTINTLTGVLVALGALDPESIQLSLKCAVLESKAKKANPPLPKRLRPAPVLSIYSGLGYAELPGRREIESALTQPRCWSALGAPSQAKAEASANHFGIFFVDLNRPNVLAMTDGTYIYWDFAMGNPYYGLMPLKVENLWRGAFGTRQNLTGRLFSAIIFLHELAHRLGGIPFDGEDYELNRCNTLKIITNCVPQAFAPERFSQKLN